MREQDGLAIDLDDFADGPHEPLDAGGIADLAVLDRDVQVGPDKDPLAAQIEVIEGLGVGDVATVERTMTDFRGGVSAVTALARAIASEPPLLFLDEPSAGRDPISPSLS